ncbi:MAG: dihydrodipicolinate synthase family protein [Inquilinaceae bacterium]
MTRMRYKGVYPILYSFFDRDGRLDRELMRRQTDACLRAGAEGIVVLGIVTEVNKLDLGERRQIVDWVGEDIAGRVPYGVTVAEPSVPGQIAFAKAAFGAGADFVVLQPPLIRGLGDAAFLRFFGAVADALDGTVAVQNNPVNLDVALSSASLVSLVRNHANITVLKAEGPAIAVAEVTDLLGDQVDYFAGRQGIELFTSIRSGVRGLIPSPDAFDVQVEILRQALSGDPRQRREAERRHQALLPLIAFMTQSIPAMLYYGKLLTARRMGIDAIHVREPSIEPTAFALAEMERFLNDLGPFPTDRAVTRSGTAEPAPMSHRSPV